MSEGSSPTVAAGLLPLLETCEQRIGYTFSDKGLLRAALTHASGADNRLASNERLEFLGDAIMGAVVCELLFHQFPEYLEGDLTRIKSIGFDCQYSIAEGLKETWDWYGANAAVAAQ